ncbi:envelope stress response membrane protein PspB [Sphingomonas parva]|uniref:Envelope stress response membrane protein PspB n=1 Tax=Sphingomonas parva TaxID=2555898 RepID=A0A4Y8ZYL2_9SPHN|nr:envelope stress response membrane protein PspB [Sphingomonas parva]TFI59706.1 envelope stress response membrane protein PspB [Sphingomonas parva]
MGSEIIIIPAIFIGLPWLILHYITRWKTAATLTGDDERLIEDLYDLSRRVEDRLNTVERILAADAPNWRALAADPLSTGLEDRSDNENLRRIK